MVAVTHRWHNNIDDNDRQKFITFIIFYISIKE